MITHENDAEESTVLKIITECPNGCPKSRFQFFGSTEVKGLHRSQVRCVRCGLIIAQPQATVSDMNNYYRDVYYQEVWKEETVELETSAFHLKVTQRLLKDTLTGKRILDVGCGYGKMIKLLSDRGNDCYGCDLSEKAVAYANDRFFLKNVRVGEASTFRGMQFDVALSFHVIEHMPDPLRFLREMLQLTAPGGHVIVGTENSRSSQAYFERFLAACRRQTPAYFTSQEHTFVFETKNISQLMQRSGMEDVRAVAYDLIPKEFGDTHRESFHWGIYKGTHRLIDRMFGMGDMLVAVGKKPSHG